MPDPIDDGTITIPGVELCAIGEWPAMTGPASITRAKFESMIEASKQGWWDGASAHPGHFVEKKAAGQNVTNEPALGWCENLRITGDKLVGDLARVPRKLAPLLRSAFRNRSIEWSEDVVAPDGKKYPAVLVGLGLMGAHGPAVSGLADIAELYAGIDDADGVHSAFVGEDGAAIVQALSTLSTIITTPGSSVGHDGDANLQGGHTVPDLTEAEIRGLLDLPADADLRTVLPTLKGTAPAGGDGKDGKVDPAAADPATGTTPLADPASVTAPAPGDPTTTAPVVTATTEKTYPETVTVSAAVLEELQRQAKLGVEAHSKLTESEVTETIKAAGLAGKIAPTEVDLIRDDLLKDPTGARARLEARPALLPVFALGSASADTASADDAAFDKLASALGATFGKVN